MSRPAASPMRRAATFDRTRTYRYSLRRTWCPTGTRVLFVLLNPSTADARRDDPTLRRCIGFARRLGHGSLEVVNLFAYRTPHPRELARAADPVGPGNDRALRRGIGRAEALIVAWGNGAGDVRSARRLERRVEVLRRLIGGDRAFCFGVTRRGHPAHPLRLGANRPLVAWRAIANGVRAGMGVDPAAHSG